MDQLQTLEVTTPSDREIQMKRVFNAPRRLVYRAYTEPSLMRRWFNGPPGWTLDVCEIDLRVGGAYRYTWDGPEGAKLGLGGVYREIVNPERLVATEKFDEAWYPGEAIVTTALSEEDGKTTLVGTVLYETIEGRDAALKSGMAKGVEMTYDSLAAVLAEEMAAGR